MKKLITIAIPCRNEEANIESLVNEIEYQFDAFLPDYEYKIQFMDNCSTDSSREILRNLCARDNHLRAIFNIANTSGSAFHGILQAQGDCCIYMASDFQDPPSLIPELVRKWEQGAKVVCAIKTSSSEKKALWLVRSLYYKLIKAWSTVEQIEHCTGFGIYDRSFIEVIRSLSDSTPSLRGLIAEYGFKVEQIEFHQPQRKHGSSSQNFYSLFDLAMKNVTSYTKVGIHFSLIGGTAMTILGLLSSVALIIICFLSGWQHPYSVFLLLSWILLFGGILTTLISFIGEYVLSINTRVMNKPFAIEEERLGFDGAPVSDHTEFYHPSRELFGKSE